MSWHALLRAIAEFDEHGGASLELVAWDRFAEPRDLMTRWHELVASRLITSVGSDPLNGEELFRLTGHGWQVLDSPQL